MPGRVPDPYRPSTVPRNLEANRFLLQQPMSDQLVDELRAQISAGDREVLDALNRRLELVARLKQLKQETGLAFFDPERERRMLDELRAVNAGPLSDEGVEILLRALLDLTKAELEGRTA
jgi:chorismate mutase